MRLLNHLTASTSGRGGGNWEAPPLGRMQRGGIRGINPQKYVSQEGLEKQGGFRAITRRVFRCLFTSIEEKERADNQSGY